MLPILLIAFPLLAALILFVSKRNGAKNLALLFSGVEFVLAIVAFAVYKNDPTSELLSHDCVWIKSLGIHFNVWPAQFVPKCQGGLLFIVVLSMCN